MTKFKEGQRVIIKKEMRCKVDHFIDSFVINQILDLSSGIFYSKIGLNHYYREDALISYRFGKLKRILK